MSEIQEARWYVVHTYSGYENKVATDLATMVESRGMQDLIQDIKIPMETVTEIKEDKVREVERKIFPGYVLIKMIVTDDSWYVVRNIPVEILHERTLCEPLLLLQMLYIYDKINVSICAEFISELFNKPNLKFGKNGG